VVAADYDQFRGAGRLHQRIRGVAEDEFGLHDDQGVAGSHRLQLEFQAVTGLLLPLTEQHGVEPVEQPAVRPGPSADRGQHGVSAMCFLERHFQRQSTGYGARYSDDDASRLNMRSQDRRIGNEDDGAMSVDSDAVADRAEQGVKIAAAPAASNDDQVGIDAEVNEGVTRPGLTEQCSDEYPRLLG
jgi:hypothetical protein